VVKWSIDFVSHVAYLECHYLIQGGGGGAHGAQTYDLFIHQTLNVLLFRLAHDELLNKLNNKDQTQTCSKYNNNLYFNCHHSALSLSAMYIL